MTDAEKKVFTFMFWLLYGKQTDIFNNLKGI